MVKIIIFNFDLSKRVFHSPFWKIFLWFMLLYITCCLLPCIYVIHINDIIIFSRLLLGNNMTFFFPPKECGIKASVYWLHFKKIKIILGILHFFLFCFFPHPGVKSLLWGIVVFYLVIYLFLTFTHLYWNCWQLKKQFCGGCWHSHFSLFLWESLRVFEEITADLISFHSGSL